MPAEAQYLSSSPGSHGYGGPPAGPSLKFTRRSELLHTVPHEKYKGIRYRPELDRFISEIRPAQPRKRKIWLGTYKTAEEAARAFDAGIYYTKKPLSYNFEDSPSILEPLPENLSPEEEHIEIQKKAKAAAARVQPTSPPQHHPGDDDDDHVVSKALAYAPYHRHSYARLFHHETSGYFYQRQVIPREIQFPVVLNR